MASKAFIWCGTSDVHFQALTKALVKSGLLDARSSAEYMAQAEAGEYGLDDDEDSMPSRREVREHEEHEEMIRAKFEEEALEIGRSVAKLQELRNEILSDPPVDKSGMEAVSASEPVLSVKAPLSESVPADVLKTSTGSSLVAGSALAPHNGVRKARADGRVTIMQYLEDLQVRASANAESCLRTPLFG